MKILITGGLGSIGFILAYKLKKDGHKVYLLDKSHSDLQNFYRCDVASFYQLSQVFKKNKFDFVYHLGAEFGRWNGEDFFDTMWTSNVIGTKNIIKLQEEYNFKMIFSSSSEVYGDYKGVMKENIVTNKFIRPMNDYATSKLVNEIQIMNSEDMFKTKTVRVRIFNTYGPGEYYSNYRSVLCKLIFNVLNDKESIVYKNHKRTSTYITDLVDGMVSILSNFKSGNVYNLAGDDYHTIEYAFRLIVKKLNIKKVKVKFIESEKFTTQNKLTDNTFARKDLKFSSKVDLDEGIARTIKWMKDYYVEKKISKSDVFKYL